MNELKIWNYEENSMRTVELNGETWFVGKDVADILGYCNSRDALATHVNDEDKSTVAIHDGSQNRYMTVINESGVYALIFGSKLPDAKKFKHWVTHEVLPVIRKTGAYSVPFKASPSLQVLIEHEQKLQQISAQVEQNEKQLERIRTTFSASRFDWRNECDRIVAAISTQKYNHPYATGEVLREAYKLLEARGGCKLERRLSNLKNRMFWDYCPDDEIDKKTKLDVIAADKRLRDIFISIIREMAVKYNV